MILRVDRVPSHAALSALESALSSFRISQRTTIPAIATAPRRHASHQAQGRANKAADGAGRRLGAKKTAGQYVVTGNILYRQRGTVWHPGDNCFMVSHVQSLTHDFHPYLPGERVVIIPSTPQFPDM
jgi:ribosomal protein L27